MPISSLLFSATLMLGTITSLTAPNWLIAWLGMEMNLLSFIPLITYHPMSPSADKTSSACKYFIAQATGSILFLLSPSIWTTSWHALCPMFFFLALMTKAGMAPMFQWFPSTIAALTWTSAAILLTWQKLTPLMILFSSDLPSSATTALILLGIMNAWIGAIYGLSQTQLRPLLAFSSISHMGWMLSLSTTSTPGAMSYLILYIFMVLPLLLTLMSSRTSSPKTIPVLKKLSPLHLATASLLLMNLAGLPPLGGFCLKAASLAILVQSNPLITLMLILASVMTLGFYIHITLVMIITTLPQIVPAIKSTRTQNLSLLMTVLSATTLPSLPLLFM